VPDIPVGQQKALMDATITPGGSVLVDCPYCLLFWRSRNPVDVTKFVDTSGKREVTTYCSKGHKLRFRTIDEWRARRMKAGVQSEA